MREATFPDKGPHVKGEPDPDLGVWYGTEKQDGFFSEYQNLGTQYDTGKNIACRGKGPESGESSALKFWSSREKYTTSPEQQAKLSLFSNCKGIATCWENVLTIY